MRLAEAADVVIPTLYGPPDSTASILHELAAAGVTTVGPTAEAVSSVANRWGRLRGPVNTFKTLTFICTFLDIPTACCSPYVPAGGRLRLTDRPLP